MDDKERETTQKVVNRIADIFAEMPGTKSSRETAKAALRYAISVMNKESA